MRRLAPIRKQVPHLTAGSCNSWVDAASTARLHRNGLKTDGIL